MTDLLEYKDAIIPGPTRPRCRPARKRDYTDLRDARDPNSGRFPVVLSEPLAALLCDVAAADEDEALELVYQRVDSLLRAEAFADVDVLLAAVNVESLPTIVSLAFVSITNAARDVLRGRADFVARVRRYFMKVDPARVEELLAGLE